MAAEASSAVRIKWSVDRIGLNSEFGNSLILLTVDRTKSSAAALILVRTAQNLVRPHCLYA
uniref:Uncharacterized protein LOC104240910 n=1 Tax=Nicotiana sylvestris TaxID=4096 RepID=A0A1U7XWX0_NICSY|nr:PREDICTED: uncharacterized protein LOC104240910 [Nicotiana sylvestris]